MARRKYVTISIEEVGEDIKLINIEGNSDYYISKNGNVYREMEPGRFYKMSLDINKVGYNYIGLKLNGKTVKRRVHRLVALTWIPNPNPSINTIVGHKDNNKRNNCVENLYWTTISENTQKAFDDGLIENVKSFDDSQSHTIMVYDLNMNLIEVCGSSKEVDRKYKVSHTTVMRQCQGKFKGKPRCGYIFKFLGWNDPTSPNFETNSKENL